MLPSAIGYSFHALLERPAECAPDWRRRRRASMCTTVYCCCCCCCRCYVLYEPERCKRIGGCPSCSIHTVRVINERNKKTNDRTDRLRFAGGKKIGSRYNEVESRTHPFSNNKSNLDQTPCFIPGIRCPRISCTLVVLFMTIGASCTTGEDARQRNYTCIPGMFVHEII